MYPDPASWPPERERTLGSILRKAAATHGGKTFAIFADGEWTYERFDAWVDRLAHGLITLGVAKGDRVAIMLPNSAEFLGLWFACARIGAIEVPVNTSFRGPLLQHVLQHSGAKVAVVRSNLLDHLLAVSADLRHLQALVITGPAVPATPGLPFLQMPFHDLPADTCAPIDCEVHAADPLAIIFTSGTTGPSKGALLSHNYFWWFGERSCTLRHMTDDERLYTCLPLFHANAQVLTAMPALLRGQTAIFDSAFTASGFWQRMRDTRATQFNYIGGMIPILMKQAESGLDREHQVRLAIGAAAPREQWRAFEARFGTLLMECYGQTEDCAVTCNPIEDSRVGSIGKAVWGYEMQVVDDDDRPVPDGTIGEFVVRPQLPGVMMLGYYRMPQETLDVFRNLWFHTGDYGSRDGDGYFWFKDRKKDAIRRRGENISAYEVEMVVNECPAVLESAAFAVPSDVGEDDVMVSVVLQPGQVLDPLDLLRHCEKRLAYFAVPRYVEFRAELPKTPTHRVEKYRLRQQGITPATWDRERAGYKLQRN